MSHSLGKWRKKTTFRDIDQCENKSTRGRAFQRTASIALRACHGVLDLWPLRALMQHLHICYLGRRSVCKLGSKQGFYIPGSTWDSRMGSYSWWIGFPLDTSRL